MARVFQQTVREHFTHLDGVNATNFSDYYRPEDVERQKILEGYGYRFLRINRFNLGRDPVRTLDVRLLTLASEAIKDVQSHEIVRSVKETAEAIVAGKKKARPACGEVKDLKEFQDASIKSGIGRKCRSCKKRGDTVGSETEVVKPNLVTVQRERPPNGPQPRW